MIIVKLGFMKTLSQIFLFILSFSIIPLVSLKAQNDSFILVLDPGHGGRDPGAKGKKGFEKTINLKVAKYTGEYIKQKHPDVKIIYTRSKDVFIDLDKRADIANKNKANLFISIHTNSAASKTARGPEVFTVGKTKNQQNLEVAKRENSVVTFEDNYEEKYQEFFNDNSAESTMMFEFMQNLYAEQSIHFADLVQKELKSCVNWKDRGVKQAGFWVLWKATMPRVLVELDFISNSVAENYLLSDKGQKRYAKAICDAFTKYKIEYDKKNKVNNTSFYSDKKNNNINSGNKKIYKVQILSSSKPIPANSKELKGYKADFYKENNLYKYTYGESADFNEISRIKKTLQKDFKDAFIISFENGIRVSGK